MKKKFMYVIMAFVFALVLVGGSAAMLTTANALSDISEQTSVSETEGEETVAERAADAYGVTVSNSSYITTTTYNSRAVYNVAYSGAQQWIDLPAGEYTLEAWGGSGGGSTPSTFGTSTNGNYQDTSYQSQIAAVGPSGVAKGNTVWQTVGSRGGAGGYVASTLKLTSTTRLYLYVGGQGIYATGRANARGGWNGGAAGSTSANGGGGGASDIRIGGTSLYYRVLVAGGGGGADNAGGNRGPSSMGGSDDGSGGAGGGSTAERYRIDGVYSGTAATQSGGYSFGNGASPTANTDTGGGGGGWYGGYASNHNNGGAGGGSSYILTSSSYRPSGYAHNTSSPYNMTALYNYCGVWNGAGRIRIMMNDAPPTTKNATIASVARGTETAVFTPSTVAQDNDSFRTLYWVDTNKVYTNSACTTAVGSDVLTVSGMTAGTASSAKITPKKYIAAGTTFYVKVRDNYGGTTTGLVGNIAFKFGVKDEPLTALTAGKVVGSGNGAYVVGPSTTTSKSDIASNFAASAGVIYNPSGKNRYTVFIPKPIVAGTPVTISAKDLFTDVDYTKGFDEIVVTSITNGSSSAYTVTGNSYVYNRGYQSVTISHNSAATMSDYLNSVVLRVQSVEKTTNTLMGSSATIEVVFKIDNTRPKLLPSDRLVEMTVGQTGLSVPISAFCSDPDNNRLEIKEVKVPSSEFIYLDKYGNYLYNTLPSTSNYYFTSTDNSKTNDSLTTGEGNKKLNFEPSSIVPTTSVNTSIAYLSYTIAADGQSIVLNALHATRNQYDDGFDRLGDFYFMARIEDKGDTSDSAWYPIAVKVNNTMPTQPATAAIADSSESTVSDTDGKKIMYFSPMGIGALDMAHAADQSAQIAGIAEDKDSYGITVSGISQGDDACTQMYNEFLLFDVAAMGLSADNAKISNDFYTIEKVKLYAPAVTVAKLAKGKNIGGNGTGAVGWKRYDEWGTDIALCSDGAGHVNADVVEFWGLKVTFLRSTSGYYIQQPIVVKDTRGESNSATSFDNATSNAALAGVVNLLIKVNDSPVQVLADNVSDNVKANHAYTDSDDNAPKNRDAEVKVEYVREGSVGIVEYTVPRGYNFTITPYDIATDVDLIDGWNVGVNSNPNPSFIGYSGGAAQYGDNADYLAQFARSLETRSFFATKNVNELVVAPTAIALNRLYFTESPSYTNSSAGSVSAHSSTDTTGKYDRLSVNTASRTSNANPIAFTVKISDDESEVLEVQVRVHVSNNVPQVRTNATNVFYLSSNYRGINDGPSTNSSNDYNSGDEYTSPDAQYNLYSYRYNVRELIPSDIAADDDSTDKLYFADANIYYYTKNSDGTFRQLTAAEGGKYVEASYTQASGGRASQGQVLKLVAVSSTQALEGGLFVGVKITDNYGYVTADELQPIMIQVEVINSAPTVNKDIDSGFAFENGAYVWKISPNGQQDLDSDKFIVSDQALYSALLRGGKVTYQNGNPYSSIAATNMRVLSSDNDLGQGLRLYGKNSAAGSIPLYAATNNSGANDGDNVAVLFTPPRDSLSEAFSYVDVIFFRADGDGFRQVASPYGEVSANATAAVAGVGDTQYDYSNSIYWAIKINSAGNSFSSAMQFTVRVRDTVDTSREGEIGYDGKREGESGGEAQVYGATTLGVGVDIGALGMTVTHEVYTDDGGRYYYYKQIGTGEGGTPIYGETPTYGSFQYNGIQIGSGSGITVPLSYFAFSTTLPAMQTDRPQFGVAYNTTVGRGWGNWSTTSSAEIFKNISLSDGITTWTGDMLNSNPYVTFEPVEANVTSNNPFNFGYNTEINSGRDNTSPEVAPALYENKQGLTIQSRGPRSGSSPLKLTLDLALYRIPTQDDADSGAAPIKQTDENNVAITAKVTVDLTLGNANVEILGSTGVRTQTVSTGTRIPSGDYASYTVNLIRYGTSGGGENTYNIFYQDANTISKNGLASDNFDAATLSRYRDSARFMFNSLGTTDSPVLTSAQLQHMVSEQFGNVTNTWMSEGSAGGLDALKAYLGKESYTVSQIYNMSQSELSAIKPNEGYEEYFSIDPASDGETLTIRVNKKTMFDVSGKTAEEITEEAASRGLVYDVQSREIYFPLKVIVYDTYNGSGFTSSTWQILTIRVVINNTVPKVKSSLIGSGSYYGIQLTSETSYTINIADAIDDKDCALSADGTRYLTYDDMRAANEQSGKVVYDLGTTDWLLYESSVTAFGYRDVAAASETSNDRFGYANYRVARGYNTGDYIDEASHNIDVTIKDGKITFSAKKRVIGEVFVIIHFEDNNGKGVNLRVLVELVNSAPELLYKHDVDTDGKVGDKTQGVNGGLYYPSSTPEVVMRTGDEFDIIVTPYDMFAADDSTNKLGLLNDRNAVDYSKNNAAVSYSGLNFLYDSTKTQDNGEPYERNHYLGVYAVAEDDAPASLYFSSSNASSMPTGTLSLTAGNNIPNHGYLSYHVKANGVTNGKQAIQLYVSDSERRIISFTMYVTVVSTPPSVKSDSDMTLPSGVEVIKPSAGDETGNQTGNQNGVTGDDIIEGRTFNVRMKVGESLTFKASDLCADPDNNDSNNMYLYRAFSGSAFSIGGNETGVTSSAYVNIDPREDTDGRIRTFTLKATNFKVATATERFGFEQVIFYVMDPSGQSVDTDAVKLIFNVYIEPSALSNSANSGNNKTVIEFAVKSKDEYNVDFAPSVLTVVQNGRTSARAATAGIILDPDYDSNMTAYTTKVYAMVAKNENDVWTNIDAPQFAAISDKSAYLLKSYSEQSVSGDTVVMVTEVSDNADLLAYVATYFEFDFGSDGAVINFIPTNATLGNVRIPLYIEVTKRNVNAQTEAELAPYRSSAFFSVSVGDSAPTAVAESSANSLFYENSRFLHFSGGIGSSRTYYMQDSEYSNEDGEIVKNLGLFSDPDTNDTVTYFNNAVSGVGYEVLASYKDGEETITTDVSASAPWRANSLLGLGAAFAVTRAADNSSITITYLRKIDAASVNGSESVKIPIRVYARDSADPAKTASTVIVLEICNTAPVVKEVADTAGKGFTLTQENADKYVLEMTVEKGSPKTLNLSDIYEDRDVTAGSGRCDIINFVGEADGYHLVDINRNPDSYHSVRNDKNTELFRIRTDANNSVLRISCESTARGERGRAVLILADSAGARTKEIEIRLTVANSSPVAISDNLRIDLLGTDSADGNKAMEFNIRDYVSDVNDSDMADFDEVGRSDTASFVRISAITLGDTSIRTEGNILLHPELVTGEEVYANVVSYSLEEGDDANPQVFTLKPVAGVYGWQMLYITVIDDGDNLFSQGATPIQVAIRVNIARDPSDMTPNTINVVRGRERYVTISNILDVDGKEYSGGYTMNSVELAEGASGNIEISTDTDDNGNERWRIKSVGRDSDKTVKLTANCNVGTLTDQNITFDVKIVENMAPVLVENKFASDKAYLFYSRDEVEGLIYLRPEEVFDDPDRPAESVLKFITVESNMPSVCRATLDTSRNVITLDFKANREVELTITVSDEANTVKKTILVACNDKPDLGFFASAMIYIRSNPWMFAVIFGLLLLLLIILIIIILAVKKKKKMRKELEALLVSEMEMEEQMLKLSAGQNSGAYYNSFGYLPPTQQINNAPMLGQGGTAQGAVPPNNAIGLNPGEGGAKNTQQFPKTGDPNSGNGGGFNGDNF